MLQIAKNKVHRVTLSCICILVPSRADIQSGFVMRHANDKQVILQRATNVGYRWATYLACFTKLKYSA